MKKINVKDLIEMKLELDALETRVKAEKAYLDSKLDDEAKARYKANRYDPAVKAWSDAKTYFRMACNTKLGEQLKAAEGRATVRTIYTWNIIEEAEYILSHVKIPRKRMEGCTAYVNINAQSFPKAYRYTPEATVFKLEFGKSGAVYVTDIKRDTCTSRMYGISYTDEAKAAIIESAQRLYRA